MAQYLLKAPDDDMAHWKSCAQREGIPFARFIRDALERHATHRRHPPSDGLPRFIPIEHEDVPPAYSGKRSYAPDPR